MSLNRFAGKSIEPERFFSEVIHLVHKRRAHDEFDLMSEVPLWLRVVVRGEGGAADARWDVKVQLGPVEVHAGGSAQARPIASFVVPRRDWVLMSGRVVDFVLRAEDYLDGPGLFVRAADVETLRSVRGRIDLCLDGYPTAEGPRDVRAEVWLTDQAERPSRAFAVRVTASDFERIASGRLPIQKALADGVVKVEGDMALAVKIGAALGRMR